MNPLTNIKNINKLNETEADLGVSSSVSWHQQYKDSAYIYIGGLPYKLSEGDILAVFSQYGEIVNINLVRDKKTGKSLGYCFIAYEDQRSTILAVDNFNGIQLLGRTIRVDHVSEYRAPKEHDEDDEETIRLRKEGCAPTIQPDTPPPLIEDDDLLPLPKKTKKEKKAKKDRKKKKKKQKEKSSEQSSDESSDGKNTKTNDTMPGRSADRVPASSGDNRRTHRSREDKEAGKGKSSGREESGSNKEPDREESSERHRSKHDRESSSQRGSGSHTLRDNERSDRPERRDGDRRREDERESRRGGSEIGNERDDRPERREGDRRWEDGSQSRRGGLEDNSKRRRRGTSSDGGSSTRRKYDGNSSRDHMREDYHERQDRRGEKDKHSGRVGKEGDMPRTRSEEDSDEGSRKKSRGRSRSRERDEKSEKRARERRRSQSRERRGDDEERRDRNHGYDRDTRR